MWTFLFGERIQGEKVVIPTPPPEREYTMEEYNQWCKEVNFGSRYGARGSFYGKNKVGSLKNR